MLRTISKQSRESVESVMKKKRKDLQKRKVLSLGWRSEGVMDDESGEPTELMEIGSYELLHVRACVYLCLALTR